MEKIVKTGLAVMVLCLLGIVNPAPRLVLTAWASQAEASSEAQSEALLDELDFEALQGVLDRQASGDGQPLSFRELLKELMAGDFTGVLNRILTALKDGLFSEIGKNGRLAGQIMMVGLIGAVFANFSGIFTGSQISEAGFYVTYLLLFSFLISGFLSCVTITKEVLDTVIGFMKALVPAFFLAVSFAGGSLTAAAGYSWMLFSISAVEWLCSVLFLPAVRIYVLFALAGNIMKDNIFSRMTQLLESGIRWGFKTTTGVVLGFHLLQSMVTPYADSLKNTAVQRFVTMLPGVGQGAAAISQLVLGSGVLLKNTIGAGAAAVLLLLSVIPVIKLAVIFFLYKGAAALLEPICDKRMSACISAAGTGCQLLLRMVVTILILFAISLAVVCMAANVTYYAG